MNIKETQTNKPYQMKTLTQKIEILSYSINKLEEKRENGTITMNEEVALLNLVEMAESLIYNK